MMILVKRMLNWREWNEGDKLVKIESMMINLKINAFFCHNGKHYIFITTQANASDSTTILTGYILNKKV